MHGYAGSLYSKKGGASANSSRQQQPKAGTQAAAEDAQPAPSGSFWSNFGHLAMNNSTTPSESGDSASAARAEPQPPVGASAEAGEVQQPTPSGPAAAPSGVGSWSEYGVGLLRSAKSVASVTYEAASAKASATYAAASAKAPGIVAGLKEKAASAATSAASVAKTGADAAASNLRTLASSGASTVEAASNVSRDTLRFAHPAVATAAGAVIGAAAGAGVGPTGTVVGAAAGAAAAQVAHAGLQEIEERAVGLQQVLERRGADESLVRPANPAPLRGLLNSRSTPKQSEHVPKQEFAWAELAQA